MILGLLMADAAETAETLSRPLSGYGAASPDGLIQTLIDRIHADPFNLYATLIFTAAIIHTFLTPKIRQWASEAEARHSAGGPRMVQHESGEEITEVSFIGQILHFLGEVEVVFGLWAIVLGLVGITCKNWTVVLDYLGKRVDYTEPIFVTVIMALAATRPVTRLAERAIHLLSSLGGETIASTWLSILIFGPLLGSLITEPGAMTISAILLAHQFYHYQPSIRLRYATIGLLFVNISVGGTLTHFAAPPLVMVTGPWQWDLSHVFFNFGWRAMVGITTSTLLYFGIFHREFSALEKARMSQERFMTMGGGSPIPAWIIAVQVGFIAFSVLVSHYVPLLIGGFLFFLAFAQATAHHQKRFDLRSPMMVGLFLAGLVIHGGLQGWWLQPLLGSMGSTSLFWWSTFLTSFNDNAAITYLATLVPNLSETMKHAVVAGAVTGGGLTVIANAPNPAGQSILQGFFPNGVSPLKLAAAALVPTLIMAIAFIVI